MRGGLRNEPTEAVDIATQQHKEACEQRLARIQNGAEPSHRNTPWPITLENLENGGHQWFSNSGRKSPIFRSEKAAKDWRTAHPKWD